MVVAGYEIRFLYKGDLRKIIHFLQIDSYTFCRGDLNEKVHVRGFLHRNSVLTITPYYVLLRLNPYDPICLVFG